MGLRVEGSYRLTGIEESLGKGYNRGMDIEKKQLKNKKIEQEIIERAHQRISAREFTEYSIREICEKPEISTGKF